MQLCIELNAVLPDYIADRKTEAIDLFFGVEDAKSDADRAAFSGAERLVSEGRAVVARAKTKATVGEQRTHVVGRNAVYIEEQDAALGVVVYGQIFYGGEAVVGMPPELALVVGDAFQPEAFDKINARHKTCYGGGAERAALVSLGAFVAH